MSGHERERLSAYLDRELAPRERLEVEAHLASCAECASRLEQLGAVDGLARGLDAEAPEHYFDDFAQRARSRIMAAASAPRPRPSLPSWTWAAAAALLLAVVTPLTLREWRRSGLAERQAPVLEPPSAASAEGAPASPPTASAGPPALPQPPVQAAAGGALTPALRRAEPARVPSGAGEAQRPGRLEAQAQSESEPPEESRTPPRAASGHGEDARGFAPPPVGAASARPAPALAPPDGAETGLGAFEAEGAKAGGAPGEEKQATLDAARVGRATGERQKAAAAAGAAGFVSSVPSPAQAGDEGEPAFLALDARRPKTVTEWRAAREAWRSFAESYPRSPHADEARVRGVEAAREAQRLSGAEGDAEAFRRAVSEYLTRDDARQKGRVRRMLPGP